MGCNLILGRDDRNQINLSTKTLNKTLRLCQAASGSFEVVPSTMDCPFWTIKV